MPVLIAISVNVTTLPTFEKIVAGVVLVMVKEADGGTTGLTTTLAEAWAVTA